MLPLRASLLALALLATCLAPRRAAAQAEAALPAAAAAPAPEMAAGSPAAENALISQFRISPAQAAVLEQLGLVDPEAVLADLQQAGVTPTAQLPTTETDPTIYDYVMFAFIKTGDVDAARRMFTSAAKPNPNIQDAATGNTPIFSAMEQVEQNPQLLELLIQNGADTNAKRKDGVTPLLLAIAGGYNSTVGLLLGQPTPTGRLADPNLASPEGLTPLLAAVVSDQPDIVEQLLSFDAGANTPGAGGELPLVDAIQAMPPNPAIVEMLLRAGANPYLADGSGINAIKAAEQSGDPDILDLLMPYLAAPAAEMAGAPAAEMGAAAGVSAPAAAAAAPAAELAAAPTGA